MITRAPPSDISHEPDPQGIAGLTVDEALRHLTAPPQADWLTGRGYRLVDGIIRRIKSVDEIETEISARPPARRPCFHCGGRVCGCGTSI